MTDDQIKLLARTVLDTAYVKIEGDDETGAYRCRHCGWVVGHGVALSKISHAPDCPVRVARDAIGNLDVGAPWTYKRVAPAWVIWRENDSECVASVWNSEEDAQTIVRSVNGLRATAEALKKSRSMLERLALYVVERGTAGDHRLRAEIHEVVTLTYETLAKAAETPEPTA